MGNVIYAGKKGLRDKTTMARLPQPGGDSGNWGDILNEYLSQSHKADGTLRDDSVGSAQLQDNSVTSSAIVDNAITANALAPSSVTNASIANGSISKSQLGQSLQVELDEKLTQTSAATTFAPIATQSTSLLRSPTPPTRTNPKSMVGAFAAGHSWTIAGAGVASSNLNDTADFFFGTQSVKVVSLSTSGTSAVTINGLSLDFTGCDIRVIFKYDNPAAFGSAKIMLGSGGSLNDRFEKIFLDLGSTSTAQGYPALPSDWTVLDIPWSTLGITAGTPNRASITNVQLNVVNKAGFPVTVQFQGIAVIPNDELVKWPNGVVTISMDDSYIGQWTYARPYLDKYGLRATFFPIVNSIGGSYFTLDNLKALRDQGHEIGAHAMSSSSHSAGLVSPTQQQRRSELEQLRQWQADNGFNSTSYAYPNGWWSRDAAVDVARYYNSARLAFSNIPGSVRPEDPFRLRAVNGATQKASLNTFVDQIKAGRSWLNVVYHDIRDTGGTSNDVTPAEFRAFVDYCVAQGVPIRTQSEVMARAY